MYKSSREKKKHFFADKNVQKYRRDTRDLFLPRRGRRASIPFILTSIYFGSIHQINIEEEDGTAHNRGDCTKNVFFMCVFYGL